MMTLIMKTTNKASGQSVMELIEFSTTAMVQRFTNAERGNLMAGKRVTHDYASETVRFVDWRCADWLFTEKCKPATDMHGNFCCPLDKPSAE